MMRIAIASDHRGFALKTYLQAHMSDITWHDSGTHSSERVDYPVFVEPSVSRLLREEVEACILICGSGAGMSMAANRYKGVYAAVAWNTSVARAVKEDDNCNILVLPADFVQTDEAIKIVKAFLEGSFKGGRYKARLNMID